MICQLVTLLRPRLQQESFQGRLQLRHVGNTRWKWRTIRLHREWPPVTLTGGILILLLWFVFVIKNVIPLQEILVLLFWFFVFFSSRWVKNERETNKMHRLTIFLNVDYLKDRLKKIPTLIVNLRNTLLAGKQFNDLRKFRIQNVKNISLYSLFVFNDHQDGK